MSRFFKSAAFPILIVVVLAFLAVKLVNPGTTEPPHAQLPDARLQRAPRRAKSKSVEFKNKGKALEVKLQGTKKATKSATSTRPRPS